MIKRVKVLSYNAKLERRFKFIVIEAVFLMVSCYSINNCESSIKTLKYYDITIILDLSRYFLDYCEIVLNWFLVFLFNKVPVLHKLYLQIVIFLKILLMIEYKLTPLDISKGFSNFRSIYSLVGLSYYIVQLKFKIFISSSFKLGFC